LFWQRSQFTNEQLPICDRDVIAAKHQQRLNNHAPSEKSKLSKSVDRPPPSVSVGDLVYLYSDRNKSQARSRYLVVSLDGEWCFIKKFTGGQLRASSYKVKLAEIYLVPKGLRDLPVNEHLPSDDDEEMVQAYHPNKTRDTDLPAPTYNSCDEAPTTFPHCVSLPEEPVSDTIPNREQDIPPDILATARPQRERKTPSYLKDYVCD